MSNFELAIQEAISNLSEKEIALAQEKSEELQETLSTIQSTAKMQMIAWDQQ